MSYLKVLLINKKNKKNFRNEKTSIFFLGGHFRKKKLLIYKFSQLEL